MTGTIVIREVDAYGVPLHVDGESRNAVLYLDATAWSPVHMMQELFEDGTRNEILAYYPTLRPSELRNLRHEADAVWYADIEEQADA